MNDLVTSRTLTGGFFLARGVRGNSRTAGINLLAALIVASALLMYAGARTQIAFAVQPMPTHTPKSYYMSSHEWVDAWSIGCSEGTYDLENEILSAEVILDFGGQLSDRSGARLAFGTGDDITNEEIVDLSAAFAAGFYYCSDTNTEAILMLDIGTNSSYYSVDFDGGQAWAALVDSVEGEIAGYGSQVVVQGANDIEPDFSDANDAADWADGYGDWEFGLEGHMHSYMNYGSADGCPEDTATNGSCNNGWDQDAVYYVSWGALPAYPIPEIYAEGLAEQWAMISQWGHDQHSFTMVVRGPLGDYPRDSNHFDASEAWDALWTAMNASPDTAQDLEVSMEIDVEPQVD